VGGAGKAGGLLTVQFVGCVALAAVKLPVAEPIVRDAVAGNPAPKLSLVALGRPGWKTEQNRAKLSTLHSTPLHSSRTITITEMKIYGGVC